MQRDEPALPEPRALQAPLEPKGVWVPKEPKARPEPPVRKAQQVHKAHVDRKEPQVLPVLPEQPGSKDLPECKGPRAHKDSKVYPAL